MDKSRDAKTPMDVNEKLSKDESGESVDEKLYRGMIESMLYLTASRPDICLALGVCQDIRRNQRCHTF